MKRLQHIPTTVIFFLLLSVVATTASAEQAYITDRVSIKLYSLQNEKGLVVASLLSNTPVEILSTDGNYAQVKTQDGKTGWINTSFLNKKKPVAQAYAELQTQYQAVNEELSKAKVDLHKLKEVEIVARNAGAAQDELNKRKKKIEQLEHDIRARDKQLTEAQQNITDLKQELASSQQNDNSDTSDKSGDATSTDDKSEPVTDAPPFETDSNHFMVPFLWALLAMLFTAIVGFMLGMKWLDQRIRKRHGGVRLY